MLVPDMLVPLQQVHLLVFANGCSPWIGECNTAKMAIDAQHSDWLRQPSSGHTLHGRQPPHRQTRDDQHALPPQATAPPHFMRCLIIEL